MNIDELERLVAVAKAQGLIEVDRAGQAIDIATAIDTFILDCQAGGLSAATVRWYSSLLQAFLQAFAGVVLASISTNDLRHYIKALQDRDTLYDGAGQRPKVAGKLSASTIIGHQTALRAFWNFAAKEYQIDNPMTAVKRIKRKQRIPRAIESADFTRIFNECEDDEAGCRNRAILAFLVDAGVRADELCTLRRDKLLLQEQQALVTGKGSETRIVVFTKYTRQLIALWLDQRTLGDEFVFTSMTTGEALGPSGLDQMLRRLKKAAGVTGRVNPHSFRHAFAREYLKAGGDVIRLAKLLGHSDVNTTAAFYAIFTNDELATMHEEYSPLRRMLAKKNS